MILLSILNPLVHAVLTENDCIDFINVHMSPEDRIFLTADFIESNAKQALSTRDKFPWGSQISDIMFLNDVLPYISLREPLDNWRSGNFTTFMVDLVKDCSDIPCAVTALNTNAWSITHPPIIFEPSQANKINSYSPLETIRRGNASCTGLSIFLVDALRSVGIPARVAGTPHWDLGPEKCPKGDADALCGNHNWVEVFIPGQGWSFVDQRRPDLKVLPLNESFFYPEQAQRQRGENDNHSIFATSFASPGWLMTQPEYWFGAGIFPAYRFLMVWDLSSIAVRAWNVGALYSKVCDNEQITIEEF